MTILLSLRGIVNPIIILSKTNGIVGFTIFTKPSGKPWLNQEQARPMRQAVQKSGIDPPISFHGLRHTYASHLVMGNVPLKVIAAILGHSDTQITEKHYTHLCPNYISETVRNKMPDF